MRNYNEKQQFTTQNITQAMFKCNLDNIFSSLVSGFRGQRDLGIFPVLFISTNCKMNLHQISEFDCTDIHTNKLLVCILFKFVLIYYV